MKICFLGDASSLHVIRWITYFRDQGHDCHLLSFTKPREDLSGVRLHYLPHPFRISYEQSNWQYLFQLPQIWQLIRKIDPEIINAHFLSSYGFLAALTSPKKPPLVISLYGSDILIIPKRSWAHRWVASYSLKHADLITSFAQHMTEAAQQYVPTQKPALTMPYGINTHEFYLLKAGKPRLSIGFSNRAMVKISHVETLLKAASILKENRSPLRFYLAGEGELRPELEKQASDLNLQDMVHFVGRVSPQQMPDTLRRITIYISTSVSDGASLSLLEAMACGAFPVVTDIPANREWIVHGENGLLYQRVSAPDLAEKISHAWQDEQLRQSAAQRNWEIIHVRGDYQVNMRRIEQEFYKLVE